MTQASTVAHPHRVPLIATFENRDDTLNKDAKLINCFVERNQLSGEYFVQKRPGMKKHTQFTGNGYGITDWKGDVYAVFGSTLYKNSTAIGSVDTSNGVYRFQPVRGAPDRLILGNGVKLYYVENDQIFQIAQYMPVYAGSFEKDSNYTIVTTGTTDFVACGAAAQPTADAEVTSGNFVIGQTYVITYLGSYYKQTHVWQDKRTDFTAIGAAENVVGTSFVATGTGSSSDDGRAKPATPPTANDSFTATNEGSGSGSCALNITSLEVGVKYKINYVGTSDFTTVGAATNTVGTEFVASGKGTGTGNVLVQNAFPEEYGKGFCYLDGTLYVMDLEGNIWGSKYLDDPRVWDPLNKIVARTEPDAGICIAKHSTYLIALKEWSSEVFYDAGNASGSPLALVPGAKSPYGCKSADSVQDIDDDLYWITNNRETSPQVARMSKLQIEVISTPAIDRLLAKADFTTVLSWKLKLCGHTFYAFSLPLSSLTLIFDASQGWWYYWTKADGTSLPISCSTSSNSLHLLQHESNGVIYETDSDYVYPNDDGVVFPVDIYSANTNFGIDRIKHCALMTFEGDQVEGSSLYVRSSDDDYITWTQFRMVSLALKRPALRNNGSFYRRAWHIRHFANTAFRIKYIHLQLDVGVK